MDFYKRGYQQSDLVFDSHYIYVQKLDNLFAGYEGNPACGKRNKSVFLIDENWQSCLSLTNDLNDPSGSSGLSVDLKTSGFFHDTRC